MPLVTPAVVDADFVIVSDADVEVSTTVVLVAAAVPG